MCPIPFGHPGNNTVGLISGKGIRLLWRVAVFDVGKGRQDGLQMTPKPSKSQEEEGIILVSIVPV